MKRKNFSSLSLEQLIAQFVSIGISQDEALLDNEVQKFNRLYDEKVGILEELKGRNGDKRQALVELHERGNMQVRLNAAKATLAVSPERSRSTLEKIAASNHYSQCGDAGMSLWNLDRGVFKPT